MKLSCVIRIHKSMFPVNLKDHTKDFCYIIWIMLGNGWKCILNCVSLFFSVILNFNALCNAFTVVQRYYTELFISDRIFCLILGIVLGNYFLTVFKEFEDLL